ncbi:MAG: ABC transporter permease [Cytophagales bacterium]|nr:ABC transporter permease [Cytophagales bacterium]
MFRNYLLIAWRNLKKNRVFSFVNILGLAIGMAACLLILQYVSFELSFDRFHAHAADLYRVTNDRFQNGKLIQHGTITYSAVGKALDDDFPEVINYARVFPLNETIITYGDQKVAEVYSLAVDNAFLQMFSFPLRAGNAKDALKEPYTVVISETLARKVFRYTGNDFTRFIGTSLQVAGLPQPHRITGICKDVPRNSHLRFHFLLSYPSLIIDYEAADHSFTASDFRQYIQLKPGTDYRKLEAKLPAFSQRHFQGSKVSGSVEQFFLQPLTRAHLYSDYEYEIGVIGNGTVVWGLLLVALLIIGIAWINYINLSTARAMERAREVGVRKVAGAGKAQLITQFLTESVLLNLIALVLAVTVVQIAQPLFNQLLDQQLSLAYLLGEGVGGWVFTAGLALVVGLGIVASGFYPAFVLSSFRPVAVLKGKYSASRRGILLRKVLVAGQFVATVALITGSLVVYRQVRYMSEKALGINIDQMLVVSPPRLTEWDSTFIKRMESFKEEVKGIANVTGAATSSGIMGDDLGREFEVRRAGTDEKAYFTVRSLYTSYDYVDVYGIKLVAGRKFSPLDHHPDGSKLHNILINEKAAQVLGFASPREAVGKQVVVYDKAWDVVGVLADYHQKSLRNPIEPLIMFPAYNTRNPISVKVQAENLPATVAAIKRKYEAFFPGNLFDYTFLDQQFARQYKDDRLFGKVFGLFSGFAILVACLGLFGLSLYAITQRTKEIGVRKVLGASEISLLLLLSKDFLRLVLLSNLLAWPLAWWGMQLWLQGFTYRITLSPWLLLLPTVIVFVVALITVGLQTLRATRANPVHSLRSE